MITKKILLTMGLLMAAMSNGHAANINKNYIKSLVSPGKFVIVIEYYNNNNNASKRVGYTSNSPFNADGPGKIAINKSADINLYGLHPCKGDLVNIKEGYSGSCDDYAVDQLKTILKSAPVIYCLAFVSEENSKTKDATCYAYTYFPGSMDSVDMIEEQLVSIGAMELDRNKDGRPIRPDLAKAENIGRKGKYGLWQDPRFQK
ncbi:hypothetical protein NAC44_20455 [Allorhizobium sp. BGMRC 0089]|uniref:hypothetical protein n=1 Tax=Allorhizobium sonneratiae TaxID=2934936 RepID=UPI0020332D4A|nr:hypothetical protein [Allorhizobium sonneratiae]MCM2294703.1 hypothetical protein [Allorhizobium sonneratiae]